MNYKTQLNAWASEMAIKAKAAGMGIEEVVENTVKLVEFAFNPQKEYDDAMGYFFDLVRKSPPNEANINALIGTLEHIQNDRFAQHIDTAPQMEAASPVETH